MSRFSGDVQQIYSSSALKNLDQSPPRFQTNNFVTSKMMAVSRFDRPAPLKPSSIKQSINQSIKPPISQSISKADQSMNWRRVEFKLDNPGHLSTNRSMKQSIDDLIKETSEEARAIVEATINQSIDQTTLTRSGSQSGLTAALLSRRSSGISSVNETLDQAINATISATINETINQSINLSIDPDQELLGRAGDSASNAAFIVRSKINGQLSIFKPADGEMTLEQMKINQSINQSIKHTHSPSLSSSEPPTPLSPGSPESIAQSVHTTPLNQSINQSLSLQSRTPLRKGVAYGETALKEAAAFLLDDGFSGVPATICTTLMVPRDPSTLPVIDPTSIIATNKHRSLMNHHSPNRSINQSIDEISVPRSSAISITHSPMAYSPSIRESINQSINQSVDEPLPPQSINQSVHQSINQSINHSTHDYVPRFGSLSVFVPHLTSADELGPSLFSIEDVHRIGILDIRLLNLDRHLGNLLVSKVDPTSLNQSINQSSLYKLHPIDHGYILPSYSQLSDVRFEWTNWRQTFSPFSLESSEYIASLDPVSDCVRLQALGVRYESLIALVFSTLLLQRGAAAGLCLHQIAIMCQRTQSINQSMNQENENDDYENDDDYSEPSVLEQIVEKVLQIFHSNNQSNNQSTSQSINEHVAQLIHSPTLQSINQSSPSTGPIFSPLSSDSFDIQRSQSSIDPSTNQSSINQSINQSNNQSINQSSIAIIKPVQFDSSTVRLLLSTMSDVIDEEIEKVKRETSKALI